MTSEIATIKKGLAQLDQLQGQDKFIEKMQVFKEEAKIKFDQIESLLNETESSFEKVVLFYGEKSLIQPNEFFKIFQTFTQHWQVTIIVFQTFKDKLKNIKN